MLVDLLARLRRLGSAAFTLSFALALIGCPLPGAPTLVADQPAQVGQGSETSIASQQFHGRISTVVGFNDANAVFGSSVSAWAQFLGPDAAPITTPAIACNYTPYTPGACASIFVPGIAKFHGDPTVVADGRGNVVYISMVTSFKAEGSGGADFILALISNDGGRTFPGYDLVNGDGCFDGRQDQPNAWFDTDISPPELHVVWRHAAGGGTFGACYRGGAHVEGPRLVGFRNTQSISGMHREDFDRGQGGLLVRASAGVAVVGYQASDDSPPCPIAVSKIGVPDPGIRTMSWGVVSTYNYGASWPAQSDKIFQTQGFSRCVFDAAHSTDFRSFGMAFDGVRVIMVTQVQGSQLQLGWTDDLLLKNWQYGRTFGAVSGNGDVDHVAVALNTTSGALVVTYYSADPTGGARCFSDGDCASGSCPLSLTCNSSVARFATATIMNADFSNPWSGTLIEDYGAPITIDRELGDYDDVTFNPSDNSFFAAWTSKKSGSKYATNVARLRMIP